MLRTIDLQGQALSRPELLRLVPRAAIDTHTALAQAQVLVSAVAADGETALREQAQRFDGVVDHKIRVPAERISSSLGSCPRDVREALELLVSRLRRASGAQVPPSTVTQIGDGATITQRWQPVSRVGLYAPGGKAAYPSSVVMNAVAAQAAGVEHLALASPPQSDNGGAPHEAVLWAAALTGIDEVYAMGGAGAIGAFAYGVPGIGLEAVDVVTGPGNVYVAAAKRAVSGIVGIDAEAGTTEILIIADETATPGVVAADLISQAEHDEAAASILVTDSAELGSKVQRELERRVPQTRHETRVRTSLSGPQSGLILVDNLHEAARLSNAYAPEHLEIQTQDVAAVLTEIHDAGAVFIGAHSPVSLGDYLAGSNHVLPTGGTARFASGLGAHTFLRPQQIINFSQEALSDVRAPLHALANAEGLPAHSEAVDARFEATMNHDGRSG